MPETNSLTQKLDTKRRLREELGRAVATSSAAPAVPGLLAELLAGPLHAGDFAAMATALGGLGPAGAEAARLRPVRAFLARTVTVEPWLAYLSVYAARAGLWLQETVVGGYGSFIDDLMNAQGALGRMRPDVVLVVADLEDVSGNLPAVCARGQEGEIRRETE